jgi:hypothetical protein
METDPTMKTICIILLAILTLAIGCGPGVNPPETGEAVDDPLVALWQVELRDFRSWQTVPGTTALMEGRGWHTELATIRANAIAVEAMSAGAGDMPEGAIFIKENFDAAAELRNVVVARKSNGYWVWVQYAPEGEVEISGESTGKCIECHAMAPNDMVFSWKKAAPAP